MSHVLLRPVIAVSFLAALTGCWFSERVEEFGGPTMGSTYTVKYVREASLPSLADLKRETDAILAQVDLHLSTYRADSVIEQFNQAPAGSCQMMPVGLLDVLDAGYALHEESNGRLDLTLEPVLNLWGFGPQARVEKVPTPDALAEAMARVGMQHLRRQGQQLCKDIDVQIDFNSIAAGYAVDQIVQRFIELGVTRYMVEVTGELKAAGKKPDGQPWRIGLEAPQDGQRVAQRVLAVDGYGISTSGDYRNYFEEGGQRYSHTLDPSTGKPINHHLAAVTVADKSTLRADGLSTVLMVMGTEQGLAFAERKGIAAFFVTREGDGFVTQTTQAFEQLFPAGEEQ